MSAWEDRMATRTAERSRPLDTIDLEISRADATLDRLRLVRMAVVQMSPVQARRILDQPSATGCACVGGPDCCMVQVEAARRVLGLPLS